MRIVHALIALVSLATTAGIAHADSLGRPCTDRPEGEFLGLDALKAKVVEQGYEIRSREIRKACGEFYVVDKAGNRAELFVDPTSGKIIAGGGKADAAATDIDSKGAGKLSASASDDPRQGGQRDEDD